MPVFMIKPALLCSVLLASLLMAPDSKAQTIAPTAAAVDRCQPALPAYDGNIRKRPKAVQNEGTATAFVTCGFSGDNFSALDNGIYYAAVLLVNNTASPLEVTCTLVPGRHATVVGGFLPLTTTVNPGDPNAGLGWHYPDYDDGRFGVTAAVSCALPPGAGISEVLNYFTD